MFEQAKHTSQGVSSNEKRSVALWYRPGEVKIVVGCKAWMMGRTGFVSGAFTCLSSGPEEQEIHVNVPARKNVASLFKREKSIFITGQIKESKSSF
jgi:hypothetical protein